MTFRKSVFWIHLAAGLIAGLVIAVMCVTGSALAFEKQLVAWAERDARRVQPPADGMTPLSLAALQEKFRGTRPDRRPTAITLSADPRDAVVFTIGREGAYYLNPYTGEVRQPASTRARDFMRQLTEWHRWLARTGDHRAAGQAVTGACNLAFLFLAASGLYLWWPRKWRTKGLRRSLWFLRDATGHARDWNWHNVIGFWFLPVLLVLTASGAIISYRWASDLVYQAVGETPPARGGPGTPFTERSQPSSGARPLGNDELFAIVRQSLPHWETVTLNPGDGAPRDNQAGPAPVMVTIKESGAWPRIATTTMFLDPCSGAVLRREGFADLTVGRQARTWLRFLHTGEALGFAGQFVAGLACVAGCFLVYTGFALAGSRFLGRKKNPPPINHPAVG